MASVKEIIKECIGCCFKSAISSSPFFSEARIILTYHRVTKRLPEELYLPGMFVTSDTFEMHLNTISQSFEIVSLDTIVQSDGKTGRQCAITFDDGWRDTYEVAFPILQKYKVPVTIFLPTALIGSSHWFWFESLWKLASQAQENGSSLKFIQYFKDQVPSWNLPGLTTEQLLLLTSELKKLPADKLDPLVAEAYNNLRLKLPSGRIIMDWDEVAEMGNNGITFGPHGLHHYILPTLDSGSKRKEIFDSLEILRDRTVPIARFFCYPNGDWDDESLRLVSEAGYCGALTSKLGYNNSRTSPLLLNRVTIHENNSHTPALFWFRIFQALLAGSGCKRTLSLTPKC